VEIEVKPSGALPGATRPAGASLLVVDDDEAMRAALTEALRLQGYRVTPAASAREAREALRVTPFDVVITDLVLPDRDGLALMEEARIAQPGALVVLMTGHGTIGSAVKALKGGAFDYILKPFRLDEILHLVSRGLDQRRLRQENVHLSEINRRLHELDQIKSDLLSAITHEFRTPLAIIHGWVDMLLDQRLGRLAPEQSEALGAVKQGSDRLGRLIGNLLAYLELERGESTLSQQEIRLPELLQSVVLALQPEIRDQGLTVRYDMDPAMSPCWLDPERVGILFANLIENAIKFNQRNGTIEVAARVGSGRAEVAITNSGVAMPPDALATLVQPFTQGDMSRTRSAGGLGLGLAVVRAIVNAYRGDLAFEPAPQGGGTTVRVRLPQRGQDPPRPEDA